MNLESRPDRKWAAIGALDLAYTPLERVRIWNAVPASDFENIEQIGEAAAADGFPWFREYVRTRNFIGHPMIVAQAWSYCQMLRHLAEHNLTGLILYDDRYILDFEQLSSVNYWLMREHVEGDLPFLMLQCEYYENIHHHTGYEWRLHPAFPYLTEGPLGCGENANLYSPDGARFALKFLEVNLGEKDASFGSNIETAFAAMSYLPKAERFGVWTAYNCQFVYHNETHGSDRVDDRPTQIPDIIKRGGWEGN